MPTDINIKQSLQILLLRRISCKIIS